MSCIDEPKTHSDLSGIYKRIYQIEEEKGGCIFYVEGVNCRSVYLIQWPEIVGESK